VSGRLPTPEGWRPQVLLIVAAVVVVPVFFGMTLWWLIASLLNGQYASTVVAVGALLVLLGFALAVTVEQRGELTDGRALKRMCDERFPTD
jgi:apolipoprotein N-acyltransferase